jgi:succinyl-CoA synthetase beta subunit
LSVRPDRLKNRQSKIRNYMRLHEYQAKEIFAKIGIPVPSSRTASTPEEARDAFVLLGGKLAVVKAQVHSGGRGKAGGIKTAHDPEEARQAASELLGRRLITAQSGHEGLFIRKVLVEEGLAVDKEFYVGIAIDRENARPVVIASSSGGMDIEEVAATSPGAVVREHIEPVFGLQPFQARKIAQRIGIPYPLVNKFVDILLKLHVIFLVNDLDLVEINPLVIIETDEFAALDAKMVVDDNAMFRHEELKKLYDPLESDELEFEARKSGISYIRLGGKVGCMVNGAGLAMATMDLIKTYGAEPANFLDVGGGARAEKIKTALEILLADKKVEVVLVNIFGGILRCDVLAEGIVAAARELGVGVPMVVRLEGTNKEKGAQILKDAGLDFKVAHTMREAGELAVSMIKSDA